MKSVLNIFLMFLLLTSQIIFAQDNFPDLITDRPDKTESAATVLAGWLQIETGAEFSEQKLDGNTELSSTNLASTLCRYGVVDKLELRLGGTFLIEELTSPGSETNAKGVADFMIGAKYSFVNEHQSIPDIALLFHLFLPVGSEQFKPDNIEPQAVISIAKSVNEFLSLGTNIGAQYNSADEELNYLYTLAAGITLLDKLGAFIEIYSELFPSSKPFTSFDAGFTYLLMPNLQLDISGGDGLFHNSKFWYFGSGISIRIPR